MNLLNDVITYIRRIVKTPSNTVLSDNLIIDYINRFWINDVDARIQLFDLKKTYQFVTTPGVDRYNMPLYSIQTEPGGQNISYYPVYQGFTPFAFVNGVEIPVQTQKGLFFNAWPELVTDLESVVTGDGSSTYSSTLPIGPNLAPPSNPPFNTLMRAHIDMQGIIVSGGQDPLTGTGFNLNVPVSSVLSSVFLTTLDAYGNNNIVSDSGQFFSVNTNYGMLMNRGQAPLGNTALAGGYDTNFVITNITQATQAVVTASTSFQVGQVVTFADVTGMTELNGNSYTVTAVNATTVTINVDSTGFTAYSSGGTISSLHNYIDYLTGQFSVTFPTAVPSGKNINAKVIYLQSGIPRAILFYDNTLTLRSVPDKQYRVDIDGYLSPAAFLSTAEAIPFGYMSEYLARGAARKILSDTGDVEQFQFYEPLFREQEMLVWKRSQRQMAQNRTETIYSMGNPFNSINNSNTSGGI